jgi:hypothetical protein
VNSSRLGEFFYFGHFKITQAAQFFSQIKLCDDYGKNPISDFLEAFG